MIQFDDAGIRNIWLQSGYVERQTRRGSGVAFKDVDGLTKAVCVAMALRATPLNGDEFRYIRKAMGQSQVALAEWFDRTEQSVAKWEKGFSPVPRECSVLLKQLCLRQFGFAGSISRTLAELENAASDAERIVMSYEGDAWISNLHPMATGQAVAADYDCCA